MIKKIRTGVLLALPVIVILALILLPGIVKRYAIKHSPELVGRQISIDKLQVNYFTGGVQITGFKMFEAHDTAVFIGFDTLIIDTEPYRIIRNEIVIEQLYLKGLYAHVEMYDSSFNFDDLTAFHQSGTTAVDEGATSAEPLRFEMSNMELRGASFSVKDAVVDQRFELDSIDFFLPYISWDQEHTSEAGLQFAFKNGGYFKSDLEVDPKAGDFMAEVQLYDMDISPYSDFVARYMDLGSFKGQTDFDVVVSGNLNKAKETKASGLIVLRDFQLRDHDQHALFGVENLRVRLKEVDPAFNRYVLDTISVAGPYVYFEMYDSTNNILEYVNRILATGDSTETPTNSEDTLAQPNGAALYYAFNTFLIDNGVIDVVDSRTGAPFKYHLSAIRLHTDTLTSQSEWVELFSDMLLNNRGKLVTQIGINPSDPRDIKVDYTITDFMLHDLNIYSSHYMGFPILYGDMYYKAHTEVIDGQIESENKLIIHNVELGAKRGGLYDLPLKFALFLLKDKDGVITLDVPVRGNLKDPSVRLGKIVWNTFKNLIIKAAAAPVKLLSGLIGADPADLERIEYNLLDTAFTEKRQRQLDLLLELEKQKPALEIELVYFNDPELEKRQIAVAEVGRMYEKETNNSDYRSNTKAFEGFVLAKMDSDTASIADACASIADPAIVDSVALALGTKRMEDLSRYIRHMNDSTEILVISSKPEAPKNIGSRPVFEVKYGMKEAHIQGD